MRHVRSKTAAILVLTAILIVGVVARAQGLGRSLWLDEAITANAATVGPIGDMVVYPAWLQTTPPVFLALSRAVVGMFGLSNTTLRLTPYLLSLLGLAAASVLFWRLFPRRFALLGIALLAVSPTALAYGAIFKHYGGELAAVTGALGLTQFYLAQPSRSRFLWLASGIFFGLLLAYPLAFVVPGIAFAVAASGSKIRAVALSLGAAAWFAAIAYFCIVPNTSPELQAFWAAETAPGFLRILIESTSTHLIPVRFRSHALEFAMAAAAVSAIAACFAPNFLPRLRSRSLPIANVCALTIATTAVAFRIGVYPISERTTLFLLPVWIVLLLQLVRVISTVLPRWSFRWQQPAFLIAALLLAVGPARMMRLPGSIKLQEDAEGAVAHLQKSVRPGELLWVHGSAAETFALYRKTLDWNPTDIWYSSTGWPCCARNRPLARKASTVAATRADFAQIVPEDYQGRLWLLYTMRPEHWEWAGMDEPAEVKKLLQERGCMIEPAPSFVNMGAVSALCGNP